MGQFLEVLGTRSEAWTRDETLRRIPPRTLKTTVSRKLTRVEVLPDGLAKMGSRSSLSLSMSLSIKDLNAVVRKSCSACLSGNLGEELGMGTKGLNSLSCW